MLEVRALPPELLATISKNVSQRHLEFFAVAQSLNSALGRREQNRRKTAGANAQDADRRISATLCIEAQCNISLIGNRFLSSQFGIESSSNGACVPHGNFKIENNTFTNGSSLALQIEGSQSAACPRDNGLTITGNTVVPDSAIGGGAGGWCSCSIASPPCGAAMEISDYENVTIENNQFLMQAGNPGYAANWIYTQSLALQGDENVTIKNNGFNNGWNVWSTSGAQWAHTEYPNVNVTECGNGYWLTKPMPDDFTGTTPAASPRYDAPC